MILGEMKCREDSALAWRSRAARELFLTMSYKLRFGIFYEHTQENRSFPKQFIANVLDIILPMYVGDSFPKKLKEKFST